MDSGDRGSVGVGERTPEGMSAGTAHLSVWLLLLLVWVLLLFVRGLMVIVSWGSVVDGVIGSGGVGVEMPEGMSAGAAHLSVRLLF